MCICSLCFFFSSFFLKSTFPKISIANQYSNCVDFFFKNITFVYGAGDPTSHVECVS